MRQNWLNLIIIVGIFMIFTGMYISIRDIDYSIIRTNKQVLINTRKLDIELNHDSLKILLLNEGLKNDTIKLKTILIGNEISRQNNKMLKKLLKHR